ncbi:MAG: MFS transporter [Propionibacteriales bacterium]|nr:MFS transporter [Propionibacteriales bacterium]
MNTLDRRTLKRVVAILCLTEITSWGILYYAFPVLAPAIMDTTGWAPSAVTGGFSVSLVTAALVGIGVGRSIDRFGPRPVMTAGSILATPAIVAVAYAPTYPLYLAAWVVTGAATSALLYPPAFAALTHWGGADRIRALTVVTLVGGLASTVFAPIVAALEQWLGWREAYVVLAGILAVITIPAHWFGLRTSWERADRGPAEASVDEHARAVWRSRSFVVLLFAMSAAALCVYAAVVNLVPLLLERGLSGFEAAIGLGLGGVGQVCGRLGYAWFAARTTPGTRSALIFGAVAATTLLMAVLPGPMLVLFAASVLSGASRGVFTLIQATAVSDRWGTLNFGRLNGVMLAPVMLATAAGPWAGSILAETLGSVASAFLVLAAFAVVAALLVPWTLPRQVRRSVPPG